MNIYVYRGGLEIYVLHVIAPALVCDDKPKESAFRCFDARTGKIERIQVFHSDESSFLFLFLFCWQMCGSAKECFDARI